MTLARDSRGIKMWISKPIYESLPYFYILAGLLSLAASMYLNYGIWPELCFAVGLLCLVGGLVVLLRRRDHRDQHRRAGQSQDL
jgi:Flp pilus assembly protein TadB